MLPGPALMRTGPVYCAACYSAALRRRFEMTSIAPRPISEAARIANGTTAAPVTGSLPLPPPDAPGAAAFGVVVVEVTFVVAVDFSVCFAVLVVTFLVDVDGFGSPGFDDDVLGLAEVDAPGPAVPPGSDAGELLSDGSAEQSSSARTAVRSAIASGRLTVAS